MSAFHRFHPQLRHAIAHELGWRDLRPVQELSAEAILDGCNVVVLAPTAGGKTEASVFPVLSRILTEGLGPVAALYVCPIRALLNNQEQRLSAYARMVGLEAFKWHGDVAASAKNRFLREPKHLLMITPESLEVMLISQKVEAKQLFADLSMVIVDEVHAFAADDRGAHLASLLERLTRFCGRDLQRIGLSATVGNPDEIGAWLQGSSQRPYRRVDPPRLAGERDLRIELFDGPGAVASEAARLGQGRKSLVFVEARSEAERIAAAMAGRGVEVFVHHSAVSRADRQLAEERFTSGSNTAIVCTSTMELGIDVGDLDLVLQVDAPTTVASFLHRAGRTGRRVGTRSNCTFLCKSSEALLQATALLELVEQGWVEPVKPVRAAAHVLAHQLLSLTLQEGGISRHAVLPWVAAATPFQALTGQEVDALVDTMLARGILHEADGLLSLGAEGERRYGRRNFFELYAVFQSPQMLRVEHGKEEVGTIDAMFVRGSDERKGPLAFRLGGRAWEVVGVEWGRGVCRVQPAEHGKVPSWMGRPTGLSWTLCQQMKRTLASQQLPAWLAPDAARELGALREEYAGLVGEGEAPLESTADGLVWHTFAGAAINRLLAAGLEQAGAGKWSTGNLSLKLREAGAAALAAKGAIEGLRTLDLGAAALAAAEESPFAELSKFQVCLPERLDRKLVAERVFDVEGAARLLGQRVPVAAR